MDALDSGNEIHIPPRRSIVEILSRSVIAGIFGMPVLLFGMTASSMWLAHWLDPRLRFLGLELVGAVEFGLIVGVLAPLSLKLNDWLLKRWPNVPDIRFTAAILPCLVYAALGYLLGVLITLPLERLLNGASPFDQNLDNEWNHSQNWIRCGGWLGVLAGLAGAWQLSLLSAKWLWDKKT